VSDTELLDMLDHKEVDTTPAGFSGHLLREAREDKELSQKEVARDLHLTSRVINAIEEGDFTLIPSAVFARGYIRSYARHLGLDGQELVAQFDEVYGAPDHASKPMQGMRKVGQQSKPSDLWVKLVSFLFVAGLIVVSVMWWQSQNGGLTLSSLASVTVETTEGDTVVEVLDDEVDSLDLSSMTANSSDVGAVLEKSSVSEVIVTTPAQTTESAQVEAQAEALVEPATEEPVAEQAAVIGTETLAADQAQLLMVFGKDCWVEITDGQGKMILSDLYSAGSRIEQVVTAPIQILLGRSSAVTQFTFDGRAIDLKPHTRKDIARLTLKK